MYELAKAALFALPPPEAHELAMSALGVLEHVPLVRQLVREKMHVAPPALAVRALGLELTNPVGLAGGFDKNARRPRALAALGFGFLELGTVTARAQEPNPSPNLFRLPRDQALINRLGFPNQGAHVVAEHVARTIGPRGQREGIDVPIAFSIGKSRAVPLDPIGGVIDDYVASFDAVRAVSDFVVVNVSSPNTKDLRAIQGAELARVLLGALAERRAAHGPPIPLLVKVAPDLEDHELDALLDVVVEVGFQGVVAANTTVRREGLATDPVVVRDIGAGGLSGPPLFARTKRIVARARERLGPDMTIIGVGGISSAHDAREMMAAGANLLQVYTAFIYRGPTFVRDLLRDLAAP